MPMSTCAGTNQDGSPCNNSPTEGSRYCHLHQDQATSGGADTPDNPANTFLRLVLIGVTLGYLIAFAVSCGLDDYLLGG